MSLHGLLVPAVVGVVGLGLFVLGSRELFFALRIYRGDPLAVAEAANDPGPVELLGTARPDDGSAEAPFSGADCLVCEWEIQRLEESGGSTGGTYWKTLDQGLLGGPFRLVDETASCRVEPSGSARHLETHEVNVPSGTALPDRVQAFLDSDTDVDTSGTTVNLGITELHLGEEYRFVERRLDVGEECYVYGCAHYDSGAGSRVGEVNVRVDGRGVRRFVIADSRERGVIWEQVKIGVIPAALGGGMLVVAATWALRALAV